MIKPSQLHTVSIDSIFPSPENDNIYGEISHDLEFQKLVASVNDEGVLEPLKVTKDNFIVSGHRRFAAAKRCRLTSVPVIYLPIYRSKMDSLTYRRELAKHNLQRKKTAAMSMKEALLAVDREIAYKQMLEKRQERDRDRPQELIIVGEQSRKGISQAKYEMLNAAARVINSLRDFWPLSVRQVHYGLLNDPPLRHSSKPDSVYQNDKNSYKDLTDLLARARLDGTITFSAIADETRPRSNLDFFLDASEFLEYHMQWFLGDYRRDLLQSQPDHVELIAEKLTVKGIIEPIANKYCLPTTIGRGYCSLEPRHDIATRFKESGKDRLVLLCLSDFDPDGDEIAESFARSLRDDFGIEEIIPHKALLRHDQVSAWKLPKNGDMEAKQTSPQYKKFFAKYGSNDVYELEAVPPKVLQNELESAIRSVLDLSLLDEEIDAEKEDSHRLAAIKSQVATFLSDLDIEESD